MSEYKEGPYFEFWMLIHNGDVSTDDSECGVHLIHDVHYDVVEDMRADIIEQMSEDIIDIQHNAVSVTFRVFNFHHCPGQQSFPEYWDFMPYWEFDVDRIEFKMSEFK